MKKENFKGNWWLPSNPEKKVPGTLFFSGQNTITLELLGSFRTMLSLNSLKIYSEPIINGETVEGKSITLCDCIDNGSITNFSSASKQDYLVSRVFLGRNFENTEQIKFKQISAQYTYLHFWAQSSLVNLNLEENAFKVECKRFQSITAETSFAKMILASWVDFSQGSQKTDLNQCEAFEFESKSELSTNEWYFNFVYPIQNLLSLATGTPNYLEKLTAIYEAGQNNKGEHIEIILNTFRDRDNEGLLKYPQNMIFTFRDVENDFSGFLERWLAFSRKNDIILNLFFNVWYSSKMFLDHRFLNIVQAVESYHREKQAFKQKAYSDEEHGEIKKAIKSVLSAERWDRVRLSLIRANEVSLNERISELVDYTYETMLPLVKNKDKFNNLATKTRNFLTHRDPSAKDKAARGDDLFYLTQILFFLLQTCFLKELGFSDDQCKKFLQKNGEYQFLLALSSSGKLPWCLD